MPTRKTRHKDGRKYGDNTCLTESVAYIFKLDPEDVPFFIRYDRWFKYLYNYYQKKNIEVIRRYCGDKSFYELEKKRKLYIAVGVSPGSKAKDIKNAKLFHAVVKRGDEYVFDPSGGKYVYDRKGKRYNYVPSEGKDFFRGKPKYYLEFIKKRKKYES